MQGSTNLEAIQILKIPGGSLKDSFLDEGYVLPKAVLSEIFQHLMSFNRLVSNQSLV